MSLTSLSSTAFVVWLESLCWLKNTLTFYCQVKTFLERGISIQKVEIVFENLKLYSKIGNSIRKVGILFQK